MTSYERESPSSSTSKEEERIFVGWWNDVQTGSMPSAALLFGISESKTQITELLEEDREDGAGNRCEAFSPLVHEIQELGRQKNEKLPS